MGMLTNAKDIQEGISFNRPSTEIQQEPISFGCILPTLTSKLLNGISEVSQFAQII